MVLAANSHRALPAVIRMLGARAAANQPLHRRSAIGRPVDRSRPIHSIDASDGLHMFIKPIALLHYNNLFYFLT